MKLNNNQLQELNNKDYKYFVCNNNIGFEIESGWEYKEDAEDHQKQLISDYKWKTGSLEDMKTLKTYFPIYTRRHLEKFKKYSSNKTKWTII
tara:strand:- start:713 stop:988 length:276 start_codon:yes stop_codon:yes gene_type:complete